MPAPRTSARVGLGVWPDDSATARRRDPGRLERLLWHAAGVGAGWIDTARVYDSGAGEDDLGRYLAAMPEDSRPPVMTKGGIVADEARTKRGGTPVLEPLVLRAQLDVSLRALHLDAVDTYLLHYPDETGVPVEESWGAVADMAAKGKARRVGLCAFGLDRLRRCEAVRHVDVYLTRLHPLDIDAAIPVLEWCVEHDTEVVSWMAGDESRFMDPSYPGPLAGTPYDQERQKVERMLSASVAAEMSALAVIHDEARRQEVRAEDVIMAWTFAQPGVTGVAVGATTGAQLDRWLAGSTTRLSPSDVARITASGKSAYSVRR